MKFFKIKKATNESEAPEIIHVPEENIVVESEDKSKKCKHCGSELIGKEKFLCLGCSKDLKAKGKKALATAGSVVGVVGGIVLTIVTKGKIAPATRK